MDMSATDTVWRMSKKTTVAPLCLCTKGGMTLAESGIFRYPDIPISRYHRKQKSIRQSVIQRFG